MAARVDERLAAVFVELADTLVAGYDLMEFLQVLAERCVELLEVDAAGLLLAGADGSLRLVAASAEEARVVELLQLQHDEGPCPDSYRSGLAVIAVAVVGGTWPALATVVLGILAGTFFFTILSPITSYTGYSASLKT